MSIPPIGTLAGPPLAQEKIDDGVSTSSSVVSAGGLARRATLTQRREARRIQFLKEEEELRLEEERELEMADKESEIAGGRLTEGALRVHATTTCEDVEKRLHELEEERKLLTLKRASLKANKDMKADPSFQIPPLIKKSLPLVMAELSHKIKMAPPKPWKGSFIQAERDGWIRTAKGYLAGIGLQIDAHLDEDLAPLPFHIIRGLMSSETPSTGVSPQQWFDSRNLTSPWHTAAEVFKAIKEFWVDEWALERAVSTFRAAKQKTLRAREFGALVESLAVACVGRHLTDDDRKEVFLNGLHQTTREYVETLIRQQARQGMGTSFSQVVSMASDLDGRHLTSSGTGTLPSTKFPAAKSFFQSSPSKPSDAKAISTRKWIEQAIRWQKEHPMNLKAEWYHTLSPNSKPAPSTLQCYNCSKIGQHYSTNCNKDRVDPQAVTPIVTALKVNRSDFMIETALEGKASDE
jgi:hypothetical protein